MLALRILSPGDHRNEEDAGGEEAGGDPEERQLHVPGAHQVVGEDLVQRDAEEAAEVGAVVLGSSPHEGLHEEQPGHGEEEVRRGPLRRLASQSAHHQWTIAALDAVPPRLKLTVDVPGRVVPAGSQAFTAARHSARFSRCSMVRLARAAISAAAW